MITINSTQIPWIVQLAILVVGIILVGSALRFLVRLAWHLLGLALTLLILAGGIFLIVKLLHL
jgi:hypothetical protein